VFYVDVGVLFVERRKAGQLTVSGGSAFTKMDEVVQSTTIVSIAAYLVVHIFLLLSVFKKCILMNACSL